MDEFHVSGLWNALIFWTGFLVGFIGLFVYSSSTVVSLILWIIGLALIIFTILKNINQIKQKQHGIKTANLILKIFFLFLLIGLMIIMNFA